MLMRSVVLAKERLQSSLPIVSIGWRGGFGVFVVGVDLNPYIIMS